MRVTLLLLCCLSIGCSNRGATAPLSDSTFVAVMSDLRRLQDSLGTIPDSAARGRILRRHRATAAAVEATAAILAGDPDRAASVWHAIDNRVADPLRPK